MNESAEEPGFTPCWSVGQMSQPPIGLATAEPAEEESLEGVEQMLLLLTLGVAAFTLVELSLQWLQ